MRQFSRFLLVGFANTLIGYTIIFGCMYLGGLTPELSNAAGYIIGLVVSYFLHQHFTFRGTKRDRRQFARFVIVFLTAYTANLITLMLLIRILGAHAALSQVIAGAVYVGTAYLLNKRYVFRTANLS